MPYAKYLSSRPCRSLEEDFLNIFLEFILIAMATRFLHGIKISEQLWKLFTQETILPSLVEFGLTIFKGKKFSV
jgi:hypothetical protein